MWWESQINFSDAPICLGVSLSFKWRFSHQELIAKNSKTPQIYFFIMSTTFYHLWRQVIESSTKGSPPAVRVKKVKNNFGWSDNFKKKKALIFVNTNHDACTFITANVITITQQVTKQEQIMLDINTCLRHISLIITALLTQFLVTEVL